MNYWHIQLHPDNKGAFPPEKVKKILNDTSYIGLGEWESGEDQIRQFVDILKIGDIVAIRSGQTPISLVEVTGEAEHTDEVNEELDWFQNRRKIRILDFYKPEYDFYIPKAMGTFSICSNLKTETSKVIINWHQKIIHNTAMNNTIKILKYKHQVILQGPPGTGKTRLAKIIADELIKPSIIGNPIEIINNFFSSSLKNSEELKNRREIETKLLSDFQLRFPIENLKNLTLDDYCAGKGDRNNFCWWIETGLKTFGRYSPGSARSYLIYWNKDDLEYRKHGKLIKDIEDDEEAMKKIAELLYDVVKNRNVEKATEYLGDSFLLKILNSYFPLEYFPINGRESLDNALKLFGIDASHLSKFEKNKKLNEIFLAKKKELNSDASPFEFMSFLFNNFNLKTGENIDINKTVVTKGEKELIQFHPAYTYEDFVRGIVAETNDKGNIAYKVENKILAEFAQKAIDNPNGNYVLIIDEINRANLPAVLGELIYALEYRNETVSSLYEYEGEREISLPSNLFIIGTMNTADRSVGHIDYAIRRRFAFIDILPDDTAIKYEKALKLFNEVQKLFTSECLSPDFKAKEVMIGHSYFLVDNDDDLKLKLEFEIKPILREYLKDGVFFENANELIESLNV
ncbi:MAG: AAA family ATPase [Bacteroidetes bacterium]|nr:AAA family ATPase [Bacteroidota bacterium]MBU2613851.1 AAA family ATPase [Patescibacteria group bacterium]